MKDYEMEAYKQAAIALLQKGIAEKMMEHAEKIATYIEDIANIMARNVGADIRYARTATISAFFQFIVVFLYCKFGSAVEEALELLTVESGNIAEAERFAERVLKEALDEVGDEYEAHKG